VFVVTLSYTAPIEQVDALLLEHRAWLDDQYAKGFLLASGAKVPRTGGVLLAGGLDRAGLDQLLAEEEPDDTLELTEDELEDDDEDAEDLDEDEADDDDAGDEDVDGLLLDDGPDPRAGRLVAEDEGAHPDEEEDLVASDVGIDGGAATAEEAAMHVVEEDDYDIRSE